MANYGKSQQIDARIRKLGKALYRRSKDDKHTISVRTIGSDGNERYHVTYDINNKYTNKKFSNNNTITINLQRRNRK